MTVKLCDKAKFTAAFHMLMLTAMKRLCSSEDPGGTSSVVPVTLEMLQRTCGEGTSCLKPYQLIGINWLALASQEASGSIIADEMGLGECLLLLAHGCWC